MLLFALGQIGSQEASETLLKFFASNVDSVRAVAVEAAGKLQDPELTMQIKDILQNDSSDHVRAEACIALFRLGAKRYGVKPELTKEVAAARTQALIFTLRNDPKPDVRWRSAFALAGIEDPQARDELRDALRDDENIWVRCFAANGLRTMHSRIRQDRDETMAVLVEACKKARKNNEWNVMVEVINAMGNYGGKGENEDLEMAARLINNLEPVTNSNYHIRSAAVRTLGLFYGQDVIKNTISRTINKDPSRTVRGDAIVAIGALGDPEYTLEKEVENPDRLIRMKVIEAAVLMGIDGLDILLELAEDDSIRVRCAALEAMSKPVFADYRGDIIEVARKAMSIGDLSLRYVSAQLLMNLGDTDSVDLLKSAYANSFGPEMAEARLKIVEAIAALGGKENTEFFMKAADDEDFDVRSTAAMVCSSMGQLCHVEPRIYKRHVRPEIGVDYMNNRANPVACLITTKGQFWIELFQDDAPTHVKNFIDLAKSQFYNKLTFHRMVSNFVVQGLDHRGDGWGYNNTRLRDEINRHKFLRGYIGMPNAGKDTGGCQMFITHRPAPNLDGNFTVFGRVISGMEVVDALEVGDKILYVMVK